MTERLAMDSVLGLLIQAHGEMLGRFVWGAHQLAATAVEHAQKREAAEADAQQVRATLGARAPRPPAETTGGDA